MKSISLSQPTFAALFLTLAAGISVSAQSLIPNGGFESPALGYDHYKYGPVAGADWTFVSSAVSGGSGIAYLPSLFSGGVGRPPYTAADGNQVAFLQSVGNSLSTIIALPADGSYLLTFQHAGRSFYPTSPSQGGNLTYSIFLDSTKAGTFSTATDMPFTPVSLGFDATAGQHSLLFMAISGGSETIDQTAFFDSMRLVQIPEPSEAVLTAIGVGILFVWRSGLRNPSKPLQSSR